MEERVHLVSWDGETGSHYHKINGTLVEYAVVATYEELNEELRTRKPVVLCADHLEVMDWAKKKETCQRLVYIPCMSQIETDELIRTALFSTKCYFEGKNKVLLGGAESSAEHIARQVLENFSFIEKSQQYGLYIGGAESLEVDEVSKIEGIMQEYSKEQDKYYIEQIMIQENANHYIYILKTDE